MAPAYRLFPFFAEGPFFHVLDCLVVFTTYAVTANQLDSNQPRHSHCMSVVMYDYMLYIHIVYVHIYSLDPQTEGAVVCQQGDRVLNTSEGPWFVSPKTFSLSFLGPGDAAHEGLQRGQDADVDNGAVHG